MTEKQARRLPYFLGAGTLICIIILLLFGKYFYGANGLLQLSSANQEKGAQILDYWYFSGYSGFVAKTKHFLIVDIFFICFYVLLIHQLFTNLCKVKHPNWVQQFLSLGSPLIFLCGILDLVQDLFLWLALRFYPIACTYSPVIWVSWPKYLIIFITLLILLVATIARQFRKRKRISEQKALHTAKLREIKPLKTAQGLNNAMFSVNMTAFVIGFGTGKFEENGDIVPIAYLIFFILLRIKIYMDDCKFFEADNRPMQSLGYTLNIFIWLLFSAAAYHASTLGRENYLLLKSAGTYFILAMAVSTVWPLFTAIDSRKERPLHIIWFLTNLIYIGGNILLMVRPDLSLSVCIGLSIVVVIDTALSKTFSDVQKEKSFVVSPFKIVEIPVATPIAVKDYSLKQEIPWSLPKMEKVKKNLTIRMIKFIGLAAPETCTISRPLMEPLKLDATEPSLKDKFYKNGKDTLFFTDGSGDWVIVLEPDKQQQVVFEIEGAVFKRHEDFKSMQFFYDLSD